MTDETDGHPPVALEQRGVSADRRMFSPTAARNAAPILAVLKQVLPAGNAKVLEIGCGTGEHAVHFATAMPTVTWLPSDPDSESRTSTGSWARFTGLSNLLPPFDIDVCAEAWGVEKTGPFDAIVSLNMVHIAPWAAALGLFAGASRLLRVGRASFSVRSIHARWCA